MDNRASRDSGGAVMKPYFERDGVTIHHAKAEDIVPALAARSAALVLTDPPYAEETHAGARSHRAIDAPMIGFASISPEELREHFDRIGRVTAAWVVSFMEWRHIYGFDRQPPQGLRFVRFGIWVKPDGAPQFTGDRPAQGWEALAIMHTGGGRMAWNGGGDRAVWTYPVARGARKIGDHKSAKPTDLIGDLIGLFSNPGDLVLDPFMGGGVVPWMCRLLGRQCIAIEQEERHCETLARLLEQQDMLFAPDTAPAAVQLDMLAVRS